MADSVNLGTVHVSLEMRMDKFNRQWKDANNAFVKLEGAMLRLGDKAQQVGMKLSLAVTAPLALLGKQAVKTAADFEGMERAMTKSMGSAEAARKEIEKLREVAKLPGLSFREAVQGSLRLQGMGASAEQSRKILLAMGNAIASMNGSMEDLGGTTRALGQILAKDKIQMEEVLQLAERQIPIFQAMKNIWGTADTEVLRKMGVTASEFVQKVTDFFGAQERVGDSAKNKIENLGMAWEDFLRKVGDTLLKGGLADAMDGFIKRLDSAVTWFGKLDPAAQTAFTNITIALAASGPLMMGIGALAKGIAGITTALTFLGKHPVLMAIMGTGALAAYGLSTPKGQAWLDNFLQSIGVKTQGPPLPTVGPFAPRPEMLRPLGQVMTPDAQGGFNLRDFMPALKPKLGAKPGTTPPTIVDPKIAEVNRRLRFELADEIGKILMDEAMTLSEGGDKGLAKAVTRQRIREVMRRLDDEVAREVLARSKSEGGMSPLLKVFVGGDSHRLTSQVQNKIQDVMRALVDQVTKAAGSVRPQTDTALKILGFDKLELGTGFRVRLENLQFDMPSESDLRGPAEDLVKRFLEATHNVIKQGRIPLDFSHLITGQKTREQGPGGGIVPAGEIAQQLGQAAKDAKREASRFTFPLGKELGNNLAYEMGREFGNAFDKIFGTGNPLARALSRTLSRLVDDVMYTLAQRAFGDKLMLSIFGGAGGLAGTGAGLGGVAGGAMFGKLGMGSAAGAGAKAGSAFGAAFAAKAAIAIAGVFAVGAGLNALLGGRGRFNVNTIGEKLFPAAPALGSAYAAGGTHFGPPINIYMSGFRLNNDMDVRRTAETLAFHTREKMRSR